MLSVVEIFLLSLVEVRFFKINLTLEMNNTHQSKKLFRRFAITQKN